MTNNFKPNKGGYRQPQLSPEEWKAKKQAEKDAVYQMIDDTATAIVQDGEKFRGFLDTQARLDRYSAANALLIYNQYPKATQLKDFGDWAEEKVSINKGAKSISILEPVEYTKADGTPGVSYNVKKVFDVSQTKGRQTPAPTVNRDPQALVAVMIDTSPVIVEVAPELPHPQMGALPRFRFQPLRENPRRMWASPLSRATVQFCLKVRSSCLPALSSRCSLHRRLL